MSTLTKIRALALSALLLAGLVVAGPAPSADAALPGNGKIAFVRSNQIYIANATGTGVKKLTPDKKNYRPQFSRDGKKIAYIHEVNGKRDLWIMNADGTGKKQITRTGDVGGPAWSPDGQWLAYGTAPAGNTWTSPLRKVRTVPPYDVQQILGRTQWCDEATDPPSTFGALGPVAWSPDGRYLAFYSDWGCDSPDNYFYNLDLTTGWATLIWMIGGECCGEGYFEYPAYSSDSKLLAYDYAWCTECSEPGPPQVEIMAIPALTIAPYTAALYDRHPAFSPNNRYLLFSNSASGVLEIWRSDLNGANRNKITNGYQPTWQPIP